mgnify:CR=1 FL=1
MEQYWFTRHEAVYRWLAGEVLPAVATGPLLDAGCGEGYGADLLARQTSRPCVGLDLDRATIAHVGARYPAVHAVAGNLDVLPLRSQRFAGVVSLQVIEHLWNLAGFLRECRRVLIAGGLLAVSTPNRPVFSAGLGRGEKPTNPFHVEEFDAAQVAEMLRAAGFEDVQVLGLHHGPVIGDWEAAHGSIIDAHVEAVLGDVGWPPELLELLPRLTAADFAIGPAEGAGDLIGIGRCPSGGGGR